MKIRTKGKIEASTSLLGYGCMRFPTLLDGAINVEETFRLLDLAYDGGVNYFDTAYPYHGGKSETVLGQWLQSKKRDSLYLVSKSPVWLIHNVEDFDRYLDEQLNKLQTDYLDFYLLHAMNAERLTQVRNAGLFEHLDHVKASGKVKRIGFSFHDEYEVFEEIIKSYDWDFCQIQFNYMDVDYQAGLKGYELATSMNIPVMIMEPIKGGQLADVPNEIKSVFQSIHPEWSDASWALRFAASYENVAVVLSGMSAYEQVVDNLKTFDTFEMLNEIELNAIAKAKQLFEARIQVPCTGCRYCMPCPFGVDIPRNFALLNRAHIYNDFYSAKKGYTALEEAQAKACQRCGACVVQCPQQIAIIESLEQVKKELE